MAKIQRPRGPGANMCGRCLDVVPNQQLRHISVWRAHRKRGWICDFCVKALNLVVEAS